MSEKNIFATLCRRIAEAIARTDRLIALVPNDSIAWRPTARENGGPFMSMGHLLAHLVECVAGCCATLCAADAGLLSEFGGLRNLPKQTTLIPEHARERIRSYARCIDKGLRSLSDEALSRRIPTHFCPEGEAVIIVLLDNYEHLLNHRYQLFVYLKLAGVDVDSSFLYRGGEKDSSYPEMG